MPTVRERFQNGWNAFFNNKDPTNDSGAGFPGYVQGVSYSVNPDKPFISYTSEKTIISAIYNRIAMDVAAVDIKHVKVDDNGRYVDVINDPLNDLLTLEANIDQTSRQFFQDLVISMFDEGYVAIVPVETSDNPRYTGSFDIWSARLGKITQWYPESVKIEVYNELEGRKREITMRKKDVAIIENPLYYVMNEPNSVLKRLVRKLNLLDVVDEQSGSGKLDLIIQLPYAIKSEARKVQAEDRRKEIEMQLTGTKYGIAYTDGTERITQLNRSINNNLLEQVQYLQDMLYSQLGITTDILNGTASEEAMINYNNRTIEPILSAITCELKRKFLTKTARSKGQSIMFFMDPFKLTPVSKLADIADRFTRNEIMSSNEVRGLIGFKPVDAQRANELLNKNLNHENELPAGSTTGETPPVATQEPQGDDTYEQEV